MIFHQRDHAFVFGAVGVMEVGFVHQNHRVARSLLDETAQIAFRSDARRRIVRVADVNQTFLRGRSHFSQVVMEIRNQRNFDDFAAARFRIFKNRFECWIGGDQFALGRSGKGLRAQFQNFARTVAEHDLLAINAVDLRDLLDQHIVCFIGITAADVERIIHRGVRLGRRPVRVFVRAEAHDNRAGWGSFSRRMFCCYRESRPDNRGGGTNA